MKKQLLSTLLLTGGLLTGPVTSALAQTPVFIQWPLKKANTDSAAVRSANITPGTTTLKHYVVSNNQPVAISGTLMMAYPAYSNAYGQTFGWLATGGGWSSTAPSTGPGSSVRRGNNEEFSFTANAAAQADSLIVTASVLNTGNGFMGLTYSRSGFVRDSAEFTGGKGPAGVLPASANGSFSVAAMAPTNEKAVAPIQLAQFDATTAATTRTYRMAFNGATGLALAANDKLTVHLHFAVSSTGVGRYIVLKNVLIKSKQVALATHAVATTSLGVYPNPTQSQLMVPHAAATAAAQVLVYSATGARMLTQAAQPGSLETTVRLDALAKGLYLVEYTDGGQRSTARIVKD
jgi:hypothetical protein